MSEPTFDPFAPENLRICERCGETLYGGSHYHCGGCDSIDVTGSYGHHSSGHFRGGKWVKTGFHHCPPHGPCALLKETT